MSMHPRTIRHGSSIVQIESPILRDVVIVPTLHVDSHTLVTKRTASKQELFDVPDGPDAYWTLINIVLDEERL